MERGGFLERAGAGVRGCLDVFVGSDAVKGEEEG